MKVLLVDPYYVDGDSPPNWSLGQIEALLSESTHQVIVEDFCCDDQMPVMSLDAFRILEERFVARVVASARQCDAIYITTSLVVPQKPMPIFGRLKQLLRSIFLEVGTIPVVVGGAQVTYLHEHDANLLKLLDNMPVTAFVLEREDVFCDMLPHLHDRAILKKIGGILVSDPTSSFVEASPVLPQTRQVQPMKWDHWNLSAYPPYRAVLTSLGCRYGCSFCFESKQLFSVFGFRDSLQPYIENGSPVLAVEDSTIFGAHSIRKIIRGSSDFGPTVRYSAYALVNELYQVSLADLKTLRDQGLWTVIIGIESPDSETLKRYRKKVTQDRVRAVTDKLHEAGILVQGCFMVGIPETSLDATFSTVDYGLDLDVDVRRWHIFQPSFAQPPSGLSVSRSLSVERFANAEVNVPDHLLPELFEGAGSETFLEEHFLIRAIPYVDDVPGFLHTIKYVQGYTLFDLYRHLIGNLRGTKGSFNEEHYYRALTPHHARAQRVFDFDANYAALANYCSSPGL